MKRTFNFTFAAQITVNTLEQEKQCIIVGKVDQDIC